jgi:type I restriction enzyme S subunit
VDYASSERLRHLVFGGTPRKSNPDYWGGDIPWISAKSLKNFDIIDSENRVTNEGANNGTKLVPKGTVLFVVRGMSLKSEFRVGITRSEVAFNQDLKALIAANGVHPEFLAYVLKARETEILSLVEEAGHGTGVLPTDRIQNLLVDLPSFIEQERILFTVSKFDNKIQLNRQTNQTLEQMAQALFKSWFVDFDPVIDNALAAGNPVPDELQDRAQRRQQQLAKPDHQPLPDDIHQLFPSEFELTEALGWVPKGWEVSQIKDICKTVQNGSTPKRMNNEFWEGGTISWFKTGELSDSILIDSSENITEAGLKKSSCKIWPKGTVLMAIYAAPTVGRLGILSKPACSNQACSGLVPLDEIGSYFIFYSLFNARDWFNTVSVGAAQQNISKSIVENLQLAVPNNELLDRFSKIICLYWKRIESLEKENLSLIKLRDTLLPKLISGELRLPSDALPDDEQQFTDATS